jgi:3-hydroxyisobutyrate dehydrogenase-like beta-hydroxyacid dehydrogenase
MREIAFIGYGEAAAAFKMTLAATRPSLRFSAYDTLLEGPKAAEILARMAADGVAVAANARDLASADWIISAVTADQSLQAAQAVAVAIGAGCVFVDINSVSPERKRATAAIIETSGAAYLDMAVMAPVHPNGHRTPVLVAGPALVLALPNLSALDFNYRVVGDEPGDATTIKMIRSQFVKGLEAITVETLLAAQAAGIFPEILASLAASYPGLGWPDHAAYSLERTLRHGARRAEEMDESAATITGLGLIGGLGQQIAQVQAEMGRAGPPNDADMPLQDQYKAILKKRLTQTTALT